MSTAAIPAEPDRHLGEPGDDADEIVQINRSPPARALEQGIAA